jgi:hypothetical protein
MFERVLDAAGRPVRRRLVKDIVGNAGFEARTPTQTHAMLVLANDLSA